MRFGGIVLLAVLALGACSSDPHVKEPPPTTSATPTSTPPTMPEQATQDTPEGAAAFVKHYVDVFNYAASTGDVAELSRLSSPTCEGCQSYIKLFRETYDDGGYFKGGAWSIGDLLVDGDTPDVVLTTKVTVDGGRFREGSEFPEHSDSGETSTVSFALTRRGDSWRTSELGLGEAK